MHEKDIKIGFIARCDDTGLGNESAAFVEHMKPAKVLKVLVGDKKQHPERFDGKEFYGVPDDAAIEWLCEGMDVIFAIETPYNRYAFAIARRMGVKSVLRINYEYLDAYTGNTMPDLYVSPVDWNMEWVPKPNMVLPFPVDTDRVKHRQVRRAQTFVHVAGNLGYMDRNGTNALTQAIPLVKAHAKFIIYAQQPIPQLTDARVEYRVPPKDYADLYKDGDVLIAPRLHSGQSLVVNEAQAAGMAIMATDMAPLNAMLPKEMLIPVKRMSAVDIKRRIEYAEIAPEAIAAKVDEWFNKDIWEYSKKSVERSESISWRTLSKDYQQMFSKVCRTGKF